jgi:hypothetical protein
MDKMDCLGTFPCVLGSLRRKGFARAYRLHDLVDFGCLFLVDSEIIAIRLNRPYKRFARQDRTVFGCGKWETALCARKGTAFGKVFLDCAFFAT